MSANFLRNRIRLALNLNKPLVETLEYVSQRRVKMPRARAVQFEVALFNGGVLAELTPLSSVTLEVKPTSGGVIDPDESPVMTRSVASASFNASLTDDQWTNDDGSTPYHALFGFNDAETVLDMTNATNNVLAYGWVIFGQTTEGRVTLGVGLLDCTDDGGTGTGLDTPPVPTYTMSDEEIRALVASRVLLGVNSAGASFTLTSPDGTKKVLVWVDDNGTFHTDPV
jgi:hypothetical protein